MKKDVIPPIWLWKIVSHSGDSVFVFPALLTYGLIAYPNLTNFIVLTSVAAMATLITGIVKLIVKRERPALCEKSINLRFDPWSFPSGHAARTASMAVTVVFYGNIAAAPWLLAWSAAVGTARFRLGFHHVTDVLAGFFTGSIIGIIMPLFF